MAKAKEVEDKLSEAIRYKLATKVQQGFRLNCGLWALVILSGMQTRSVLGFIIVLALAKVAEQMICIFVTAQQREDRNRRVDNLFQEKEILYSQAEALTKDTCCGIGPSVIYQGCSGSVHTFLFSRYDYAENFALLNHKKLVQ
ncbi:MAG TPA: hypothetical protein VF600_07205 [Abditibacteriaceae bacterium]|jgi:hypothetical protein